MPDYVGKPKCTLPLVYDAATKNCVLPVGYQGDPVDESCPINWVRNLVTGECEPPDCLEGGIYNNDTGQCEYPQP